jgi:predicted negative regulator of RcsB-dependent stress response
MANHLDLDEQEQLDELKHFWKQYGNLITWALIVVLGVFTAWNGYQYWQRSQSAQSAAMFDEVERSLATKDAAKIERALTDMNAKFGSSAYAQQAGLLAAKTFFEQGNSETAKKALMTVVQNSKDEAYQAIAKLRLASILVEGKKFDEALKQLEGTFPKDFVALADDRRGDVFALQKKPAEAKLEYVKAYKGFDERAGYRRLVEVKINALGGDPVTVVATADVKPEAGAK